MVVTIDLNADVGEGFGAWSMGDDANLLAFVTSANVACGFHAGDPRVIDRTVALVVKAGVALGAHPSHYDLRGFGRRTIAADPAEVEADVLYQLGALLAFAGSHGKTLAHVKPHGALYNQAALEPALARAIARGVARVSRSLVLVGAAGSEAMRQAAAAEGLRFAAEAFADRAYESDGTLVPRGQPGAVITDSAEAAARAVRIASERRIAARDGTVIPLAADTLCLHGDTPGAVAHARAVRAALEAAGIAVRPLVP
ncbi:MAG TPA: 5-oxoprolinase subunit PxpA [Vicinamibacteria bacterium]|nr:5-oxoprolinase subunit PxpA [Vicinamibacteria bacterium]